MYRHDVGAEHAVLSDTDRAYLAGLFDGEGSIGYYSRKRPGRGHRLNVCIVNTDFRLLSWLRARIEYGVYRVRKPKRARDIKLKWEWMLDSKRHAKEFLDLIRPYLIIKADQVDLLLQLVDEEQKYKRRSGGPRLTEEMLNRRTFVEHELKRLKVTGGVDVH